MTFLVTLAWLSVGIACSFAGPWGEPLAEPQALLRMIESLEKSGDDRFMSKKSAHNELGETYHLRSISYLGTAEDNERRFLLAGVHFIRSSPAGRETPPARGHSYLVVFRSDFSIAASAYENVSDCHMSGNRLWRGEELVIDFDARKPAIRHAGYLLKGGAVLPYFFADRITDDQWGDEKFMRQQIEAEKSKDR